MTCRRLVPAQPERRFNRLPAIRNSALTLVPAPVNRINNVRTMRGLQFAEDASPMAHPIRPDMVIEMNNFYTLTVYEKGAEVIRMIHTLLGEENFQKGMQLYFERHDGSAATCDDFVAGDGKMHRMSISLISAVGTASPVRRL
ncbi:aminopeptidase N [Escherichia coli]|uniref:Aminopeptidase N n=1 Tax=Escherichia coli TaxID=562 RepID=A0A377CZ34_ECOLX|nr:aminopeptidase N [Escherichia coli]